MKPTDPEDSPLDAAALAQGHIEEIERDYDSGQRKRFLRSSHKGDHPQEAIH